MGRPWSLPLVVLVAQLAPRPAVAQAPSSEQISRAHQMLAQVRNDLRNYYYDSTFGGVNIEAKFRHTDSTLDQAGTVGELFGEIAQYVFDLHDSHTNFYPPGRAAIVEYGWRWNAFGNNAYVTWVKKGSDAEAKGLAVGDRVISIDGMTPTRDSRWIIGYLYNVLNPRPGMHVQIMHPDERMDEVDVLAKVTPTDRVVDYGDMATISRLINQSEDAYYAKRHWWREFGDTVLVWHFTGFQRDDDEAIDLMMDRARQHKTLILDLRNNGGGAETTMLHLIGHFIDHPQRVGRVQMRNKVDSLVARPVGKTPFRGNLVILVNSNSASASEITTRFLQLEGYATVVGDRSAGAVMGSVYYPEEAGFVLGGKHVDWGVTVSVEDIIMGDGNRLENTGVTPEWIVVPTGADIAAKRDPQMTKALALAGIQVDPVQAAKIYSKDFGKAPATATRP
jgi:C-terminal processing protease CtpA/Prc